MYNHTGVWVSVSKGNEYYLGDSSSILDKFTSCLVSSVRYALLAKKNVFTVRYGQRLKKQLNVSMLQYNKTQRYIGTHTDESNAWVGVTIKVRL